MIGLCDDGLHGFVLPDVVETTFPREFGAEGDRRQGGLEPMREVGDIFKLLLGVASGAQNGAGEESAAEENEESADTEDGHLH